MKTLLSLIAISFLLLKSRAFSDEKFLGPTPLGPEFRSEIDFSQFARIFNHQHASELCWAASISNIFGFYGHPVTQERIVSSVFGGAVNNAAPSGAVIAQQVNREWTDDNGKKFRAKLTAAYDFDARVAAINNAIVVNELKTGHPLIICNLTHCMVLTLIDYTRAQVLDASVFDPFVGPRALSPLELSPVQAGGQLRFLASVSVEDEDDGN